MKWAVGVGRFVNGVAVHADGSTMVTGYFVSTASFGAAGSLTSAGDYDGFVATLSAAGAYLCALRLGGSGSDTGSSVATHADGSTMVTGTFAGTAFFGAAGSLSSTGNGGFVAKISAAGAFLWAVRCGAGHPDIGNSVATHADGSTVVGGTFEKTAFFGAAGSLTTTNSNCFTAQLSEAGAFLWAVRFGSSPFDTVQGAATHADGSTVVTGYFSATASFGAAGSLVATGTYEGFVAKISTAGAFLWAVRFGGSGNDFGYDIATHTDGSTMVTGSFVTTASFGAAGSLVSSGSSAGFVS
jgi:hypothetical protein